MGFYVRRSINVGPLRFNLSKSGIGVSAGIKGLRVGVGPRGNYVYMGRSGLYYGATRPLHGTTPKPSVPATLLPPMPTQRLPPGTHAPLEEIESAEISKIVDSSSQELLDELNRARSLSRVTPVLAVILIAVLGLGLASKWPVWQMLLFVIGSAISLYVARTRDVLKKSVVLFYDFDADLEAVYAKLHEAAERLATCAGVWHIEASGKVHDRKYHAGASDIVRRKSTAIFKSYPPYVQSNVETIAVGVGRQTLHFFPDRVLVFDSSGVGAVSYSALRVSVNPTQFVEEESVPKDAEVVGETWRYVNKSGGPDRRFKENRRLPVCRYEEISLSSSTGLNELLQLSRCGVGRDFAEAISQLGRKMPKEKTGIAQAT